MPLPPLARRPCTRVRFALRRAPAWGCGLLAIGCSMPPYQPEDVAVPAGPGAFTTVAAVVRARFPRLLECDVTQRRLQSDWVAADGGVVPGRRRVTVFPAAGERIAIVVELSWLRQRPDGIPYWTPSVGDRYAERELAAAVRSALAGAEISHSP